MAASGERLHDRGCTAKQTRGAELLETSRCSAPRPGHGPTPPVAGATQVLIPLAARLPRRAVAGARLAPGGYPPEPGPARTGVVTAGCLVHRAVSAVATEWKW